MKNLCLSTTKNIFPNKKTGVEYIFLITFRLRCVHKSRVLDTSHFPKKCALSQCLLVFDFRFSFFRYKNTAAFLLLSLFFKAIKCNFYTFSTTYINVAYKSIVSAALKIPCSTLHFILFPHEITISY